MLRKFADIFCSLAVLLGSVELCGADLVLQDGRVYKNYRVKAVNNNIATVVYSLPDGTPDVVYLNAADVANAPQTQLTNPVPGTKQSTKASKVGGKKRKSWRSARTLRGKLMAAGEQLYDDVNSLPPGNRAGRIALANRMRSQIQRVISGMGETADFKLVSANQNGMLLRVVGTESGARFKSGQHIYVQGTVPQSRTFKLRVYPGGEIINYGSYGNVMVYALTDAAACEIAIGCIGNYLGDNTVFNPPPPEAANLPMEAGAEKLPQNTVINNYYIEDDNRIPAVVWRNGSSGRPPKKPTGKPDKKPKPDAPAKPNRPDVAPGKRLGNPEKAPEPDKKRPVYKWSKSSVNKNNGHSGNYGVLPEWAQPGQTRR